MLLSHQRRYVFILKFHDVVDSALTLIHASDLKDIKSHATPPPDILPVLEALAMVLGGRHDWASIRNLLGSNLIDRLRHYDKEHIPAKVMKRLLRFCSLPEFTPENVGKTSPVAAAICQWLRAIVDYDKELRGH